MVGCAQDGQDLAPLEKPLNAAGYQLYYPPRSNWGPGFVFYGDIVDKRITNVSEICPNLYGEAEAPQSANILLTDYTAKDAPSFSASIRVLAEVSGFNVDLDKIEQERSIEIKWQNVRETSYSQMDRWLRDGTIRPIPIQCRRAIESLQGRSAFADHVFVIVRAVAPESLKYYLSTAGKTQGSAGGQFLKDSKAKMQAGGSSSTETELVIRQQLYVGYAPPVRITEWIDSGLTSGELFGVKGASTDLQLQRN